MLRWIYPITCELCHEVSERSLCPDCLARLERVPRPICLYCGAPLQQTPAAPAHCEACSGKPRPFDLARSALVSTEETMELVYKLKYHHAAWLAGGLAPALADLLVHTPALTAMSEAALVPVPVTRKHLNSRGYNQAEELARALGKLVQLPVIRALQRDDTDHDSQTRLSARQRQLNAYRAFQPTPDYTSGKHPLPPQLILVDDVFTSGATARACSRALRQLPGVKEIAVITLIRILQR
ncbi:MAG: ComF family protein [Akkermansia sp.]|nr:ComF family protein [Akkermansia sp.]